MYFTIFTFQRRFAEEYIHKMSGFGNSDLHERQYCLHTRRDRYVLHHSTPVSQVQQSFRLAKLPKRHIHNLA